MRVGDDEESVELAPGEETEPLLIPAAANLVATLTLGDKVHQITYTEPANCDSPALPVTGANAGILAGAALALVAGGTGLFFAARRRRIRFAA